MIMDVSPCAPARCISLKYVPLKYVPLKKVLICIALSFQAQASLLAAYDKATCGDDLYVCCYGQPSGSSTWGNLWINTRLPPWHCYKKGDKYYDYLNDSNKCTSGSKVYGSGGGSLEISVVDDCRRNYDDEVKISFETNRD